LRAGSVFVTTGDPISEAYVTVRYEKTEASMGGELVVDRGRAVRIDIRVRDPDGKNPALSRIDLIKGNVGARSADLSINSNSSTRVIHRFTAKNWRRVGEFLLMRTTLSVN
jgi:hypothetical protein